MSLVSLKDIAKECGVSVATVSKALNNHSDISEETKERVIKKASDMGYMPNSAARMLKMRKSNTIGVIFVDEAHTGLKHHYFNHVLESLRNVAEAAGYDIMFISRQLKDPYYEHCVSRGVDGVAIVCVNYEDPEILRLINSTLPVVTIDHVFNSCTTILSDNADGICELTKYAISKGHRKIAYIHGYASSVTQERLATFYKTLYSYGIEVPDAYVREADYLDTNGSYEATKRLLELSERPTCILYPDDFAALGGIKAIHEAGLSIPEDISIIGYDGTAMAEVLTPKLTTWQQNTQKLGEEAARRLITAIEQPKTAMVERIVVRGKLIEGSSVKDIQKV